MLRRSCAITTNDVAASHASLDLLWARLAVHIRAEHLHLFPAVINGVNNMKADRSAVPTRDEVRLAAERLRADHDFFMHELAQAIGILRDSFEGHRPSRFRRRNKDSPRCRP